MITLTLNYLFCEHLVNEWLKAFLIDRPYDTIQDMMFKKYESNIIYAQ